MILTTLNLTSRFSKEKKKVMSERLYSILEAKWDHLLQTEIVASES
jgi:hypothetical protein